MNVRFMIQAFVATSFVLSFLSGFATEEVSFAFRHLLAGRASLTDGGFVEARAIGAENFAPELGLPVELVYRSASESSGVFGRGWSCPQLESSAKWDKDGLLWTAPWGEKVKFFPALETDEIDSDVTGYTDDIGVIVHNLVMLSVWRQIDELVVSSIIASHLAEGSDSGSYDTLNTYSFVQAFWVFGGAEVSTVNTYTYNWTTVQNGDLSYISYSWESVSSARFKDDFHDPAAFGETFGRIFENDLWVGERYLITHQWEGITHKWQGIIE